MMTGKQLKNTILQEAIQGHLVPQDPNDEPASVLLERIRKEKAKLVKDGKLKKKDLEEAPISEDEIPFEIPESWGWVRLSQLCVRFSTGPFGTMVHKEDYVDSVGHPLVNPTNIKNGHICSDGIKMVSDSKYEELSSYVLQCDDLVLARRGDLSKIAIVSKLEEGWLAGTGAFFMHFIGGLFLPYFIQLYSTSYCQNYLLDQSVGGTMNNLNQKLLADFVIPLPPLAEQKRIMAKIEELLPKVEEYGKAQEALNKLNDELPERLKKSILQEAIEGRLVPQDPNDEPASVLLDKIRKEKAKLVKEGKLKKKDLDEIHIKEDEIPFKIPESWEWVRINYIAISQLGKTLDRGKQTGKEYPYLCSINVYWEGIDLNKVKTFLLRDDELEKYRLKRGDLLVCEGGDYGRCNIWDRDEEMYYQNALHRIRFFGMLSSSFYKYVFEFYRITDYIEGQGQTIKHFTYESMKKILFPLPPLAEQHRIVEKLEQLLHEIDKLKV